MGLAISEKALGHSIAHWADFKLRSARPQPNQLVGLNYNEKIGMVSKGLLYSQRFEASERLQSKI